MGTRPRNAAPRIASAVLLAGMLTTGLVGCTETSRGGSDNPGVSLPPSVPPGPAGDALRKSVARASEKDIAAALRANDVDDPEHWAKVVSDNQPYPVEDRSMSKLRQILIQQQADPATIDKVTNALAP